MTTTNGTALAKVEHATVIPRARGFEPGNVAEAIQMAELLFKSGTMPPHIKSPAAAFAILAAGRELGLSPMQSMRAIHFFEGRVTLSSDLIVALVKNHPECLFFRVAEATNERVTCETQRKGDPSPTRITWTMEDAKRAGLTGKQNWARYPRAMLRARVSAELARAVYPDAMMGIYDPDELEPAQPTTVEVTGVVPDAPKSEPRAVEDKPKKGVNTGLFRKRAAEIRAAKDGAEMGAAAAAIKSDVDAGDLSHEQREKLKVIYAEHLAKLTAAAPEPDAQDEQDAAEVEAEVMAGAHDAD